MEQRDIELHLAQLSKCIVKSKINKYSDARKKKYQESLVTLYDKISTEDFSTFTSSEIANKKKIVDFIFYSIQFLDNSTLTIIPFEIVFCLEQALTEWIPGHNFIIVTSLSNDLNDYKFTRYLALEDPIYQLIEAEYSVKFEFRLVQITLPRYFVHDYLSNVVLYHELGHFIDHKFKISETIVVSKIMSGILNPASKEQNLKELRYYMEHFADVFAAQYIGDCSNHVLNYIAHNASDQPTHPATATRIKVVNDFLAGNNHAVKLNEIMTTTLARAKMDLKIRFVILPVDDFKKLIPLEIKNVTELHSAFLAGWTFWREKPNDTLKKFGREVTYKITNNLLEKSISNYIIKDKWK
ncbi:MAG: hypothetical protein JSU07_00570 [Bacteroidetes bacterium]|nr:hypothetical protein [Bacteroidota bacterium]